MSAVKRVLMKPSRRSRVYFSDRKRDVLTNVKSPNKWWSTLKSAVFGSSSLLPPILVRVVDRCVSRLVKLICCKKGNR